MIAWGRRNRRDDTRRLEARVANLAQDVADRDKKLATANHELARLGDEHHFLHQRFVRERRRTEELTAQLRQCNAGRIDAQAQQAVAQKAADNLAGRLNRIRAVLAVDRLAPDVRLAQVHQVLTEGRAGVGGEAE